ncbi:glycosyltransferase family 2 protein [Microbacterium sp. NPDC089987]|uniref:glycosyltransferase family 2 protein n=1 Tax=Microbacterium sp. NPDC089987 TaxID=3364202 RepID=UPI00382B5F9F
MFKVMSSVSVVIPFYNSSATLSRALASVAAQSHAVREVIVVDDASRATERSRANAIVERYPIARLISLEQNKGPGFARNIGWNESGGAWIAFLDSDDAWHPRKVEMQLSAVCASRMPLQMVASRTLRLESVAELDGIAISDGVPTREVTKRALIKRNRMATSSVMVRRDVKPRFAPNRRFSEDYELWLTIAGMHGGVALVNLPLVAQFKAAYGASGLSSRTWSMIFGEYLAYWGARRARAMSPFELALGLSCSTVRALIRLLRLTFRSRRSR